ncbi:hypothetical protein B0H16DRAFT_432698 [Mycena metata]|uniref:Uncharacterized protein n=1 Tax=Mycena metata TaxID=1033252 RepID=A0AAD7HD93_9AGAR|nr:hypothetical protein B0H16DRAFT_432698 [Mycena metata]
MRARPKKQFDCLRTFAQTMAHSQSSCPPASSQRRREGTLQISLPSDIRRHGRNTANIPPSDRIPTTPAEDTANISTQRPMALLPTWASVGSVNDHPRTLAQVCVRSSLPSTSRFFGSTRLALGRHPNARLALGHHPNAHLALGHHPNAHLALGHHPNARLALRHHPSARTCHPAHCPSVPLPCSPSTMCVLRDFNPGPCTFWGARVMFPLPYHPLPIRPRVSLGCPYPYTPPRENPSFPANWQDSESRGRKRSGIQY